MGLLLGESSLLCRSFLSLFPSQPFPIKESDLQPYDQSRVISFAKGVLDGCHQ